MYAARVSVTIDPEKADAARSSLHSDVIRMVKASPGFIGGYWFETTDSVADAVVLFDTLEQAQRAASPEAATPAPGVTVKKVDFRKVVAHA